MKKFYILFFLIAFILAIYPFLQPSEDQKPLTGLPWQIEILPDGSTRVFGITIGESRLSDVVAALGDDMELAIVAASDEVGSLEMYYGQYRAGLLSGRLVFQTGADEQDIGLWRDQAVRSEYMATGKAKKYFLSQDVLARVLNEAVTGITFIPVVNLDEEVILARFGEPEMQIRMDGAIHYLYPDKGLDITLHQDSKEVLQYVSPGAFQQLIAPLQ